VKLYFFSQFSFVDVLVPLNNKLEKLHHTIIKINQVMIQPFNFQDLFSNINCTLIQMINYTTLKNKNQKIFLLFFLMMYENMLPSFHLQKKIFGEIWN